MINPLVTHTNNDLKLRKHYVENSLYEDVGLATNCKLN